MERSAVAKPQPWTGKSFIVQHYHSTGCAGGAFCWRAAMLDPEQPLVACMEPREYRATTAKDISLSVQDKRRGGGPRVGPFQAELPGSGWLALPKYDFTTRQRSTAFNERMHVEWESHVDHVLRAGGELPTASVTAKAGFRSCAPCLRDMMGLAAATGKSLIMVDLADDDTRGTFHFVLGDRYVPIPKEGLDQQQVSALKGIVLAAQAGTYPSTGAIAAAVEELGLPVDSKAQALYARERLLPSGCAEGLRGEALLRVIHAEHFARLPAEYGASILRDRTATAEQRQRVLLCRKKARTELLEAWRSALPSLSLSLLEPYATAAIAPLLTEDIDDYETLRRRGILPAATSIILDVQPSVAASGQGRRWGGSRMGEAAGEPSLLQPSVLMAGTLPAKRRPARWRGPSKEDSDDASTAVPDDAATMISESDFDFEMEPDEALSGASRSQQGQ
mmetsp:Transcript_8836/g.19410  ORF Transcript_8836/g.19410 Transcript_8836/m.19410 type:complete len:449 (-) Transcript_8836:64-1410(-)